MLEWRLRENDRQINFVPRRRRGTKIRAATDRDKTVILADAYKRAQQIRGEGKQKP